MSTTKKANTKARKTENMPKQMQHGSLDAAVSSSELHQTNDQFMIDGPGAKANEDDVTLKWRVRVIRGEDIVFLDIDGVSTMNRIFAPENLAMAPSTVQEEIFNKVALPIASAFQAFANHRALELTAAEQDEDLAPLT